jgi:hypothetical protein
MRKDYRGVSLPKELVDTVEDYIRKNPTSSYKSLADFVIDAVRRRLQDLGALPPSFIFIHINVNDNYALFWEQKPGEKGHSVKVYFSEDSIKCGYCDSNRCYHVKMAVKEPDVIKEFERRRKLGLKIPDLSYLEEE